MRCWVRQSADAAQRTFCRAPLPVDLIDHLELRTPRRRSVLLRLGGCSCRLFTGEVWRDGSYRTVAQEFPSDVVSMDVSVPQVIPRFHVRTRLRSYLFQAAVVARASLRQGPAACSVLEAVFVIRLGPEGRRG